VRPGRTVTAMSPSLSALSLAAITEAVDSVRDGPGDPRISQAHAAAAEAAAIAQQCAALASETPERRTG